MQKVKSGDPVAISAAVWNDVLDAAALAKRTKRSGAGIPDGLDAGIVRVKNTTEEDLDRFAALEVGADVGVRPDKNELSFQNEPPVLFGRTSRGDGPWVVLQEPIPYPARHLRPVPRPGALRPRHARQSSTIARSMSHALGYGAVRGAKRLVASDDLAGTPFAQARKAGLRVELPGGARRRRWPRSARWTRRSASLCFRSLSPAVCRGGVAGCFPRDERKTSKSQERKGFTA